VFQLLGLQALLNDRGLFVDSMDFKTARSLLLEQPDIKASDAKAKRELIAKMALGKGRTEIHLLPADIPSLHFVHPKTNQNCSQLPYVPKVVPPLQKRARPREEQPSGRIAKGIKRILSERGLWNDALTAKTAKELLKKQPDFACHDQPEWLRDRIINSRHMIDFYPKYHCELNFIERFWAMMKVFCRKNCNYTLNSLRIVIAEALKIVGGPESLDKIRRFHRGALRYMDAYRPKGDGQIVLNPKQAAFAVKQHKHHRTIPNSVLGQLEQ
jgi:transposase